MAINKVGINQLRIPDYEELNWHVPLNENFNILAARGNLVGNNRVVDGFAATDVGSGSINIADGYIYAGDFFEISGGIYTIPTNTSRIVYIDSNNTIQVSATLPALGLLLLFYVVNNADVLTISQIFTPYQASPIRKNYFLNGNFDVWQRGTTQTSSGYGSDDHWYNANVGSTKTVQRLAYSAVGTNYPSTYYSRTSVTSVAGTGNYVNKRYRVLNVSTLSGKVMTLSFSANADAARPIALSLTQVFGIGGSPSESMHIAKVQLDNIFNTRYSVTFKVPSTAGKTLGTGNNFTEFIFWFDAGSNYNSETNNLGQQSGTFNLGDIQLEDGPIATAFEYRQPSDELSLCRQWYERYAGALPVVMTQVTPTEVRSTYIRFNTRKFKTPTITVSALTAVGHSGTPGAFNSVYADPEGFIAVWFWTMGTVGHAFSGIFTWIADADIY